MKRFAMVFCTIAVLLGEFSLAEATVLTFDDLASTQKYEIIPSGYGGLNWNGFGYAYAPSFSYSGFQLGRVSDDHVAFNLGAGAATVSGSLFDFNGVYLTAAWRSGLNIRVQGFKGEDLIDERTVVANWYSPTWFDFNFSGIDRVVFESFGGTDSARLEGEGAHFVMDNFTFNENAPVPEPATMLLLASGLVGLAGLRRKFKTHQPDPTPDLRISCL